jgi:ADP-heptose:LPS heptosyltransferase
MGYGGDLIWSGVFRALHDHDGRQVVVVNTPKLSDLLVGRMHDRGANFSDRPIFLGNPRVAYLPAKPKGRLTRLLDLAFAGFLKVTGVRKAYERTIFALAARVRKPDTNRLVHVDMLIHSYAAEEFKTHFVWKQGGHAIETILHGFGVAPTSFRPELYLEEQEQRHVTEVLADAGVSGPFIVCEPDSNPEWFGELRSWPREQWVELVQRLRRARPDIIVVQVGVPGTPAVPDAVDIRGRTTFREAAALIARSQLFIGTEGGLMHAARAVDAKALILWGGVTLPEFAGYPASHRIICHRVACAPCGQFGWCNNGHVCMRRISVDETLKAALECLP